MFGKLLLAAVLGQIALCATAKADSPEFTFSAADQAFSAAAVPSAAQLTGKWYLVGIAEDPAVTSDLDGYWPNGEFQLPGYSGYFYQVANVSAGSDAFGNVSVIWNEQRVGAETGDLYDDYPATGSLTPTGLDTTVQATAAICASASECRIVGAEGMLLCRMVITDTRFSCRQDSADNTQVTYMGYQMMATAP